MATPLRQGRTLANPEQAQDPSRQGRQKFGTKADSPLDPSGLDDPLEGLWSIYRIGIVLGFGKWPKF